MLTQELLKKYLSYNPETGLFIRLITTSRKANAGLVAGRVDKQGYVRISVMGKHQKAHRLAFLYMTGAFPSMDVDHINGNRSDNRWINLRDVPASINVQNIFMPQTNGTSGYRGVSFHKKSGKYRATIRANGKTKQIGTFLTAEEAGNAYLMAKSVFHAEAVNPALLVGE